MRQSALEDVLEKSLADLNLAVLWRHEVPSVSSSNGRAHATVNKLKKKFRKDDDTPDAVHTEWAVSKALAVEPEFVWAPMDTIRKSAGARSRLPGGWTRAILCGVRVQIGRIAGQ